MNGQWIGTFSGANNGFAMVNIDDMGDHYEGIGYFMTDVRVLPTIFTRFRTLDKRESFQLSKQPIFPINPNTMAIDSWDNVQKLYKEASFSHYADVEGNYNAERLKLTWKTEIGLESSCELPRSIVNKKSGYQPIEVTWDGYKDFLISLKLEPRKFIFRGQEETWRLQTKFHRTGRANLERFLEQDRAELFRHLSARTKHIFNINNPDENGAFLNLVQHHGYPTPLLDWTYSPYVAAFFAYRNVNNQQAVSTMTNVSDIEMFIEFYEKRHQARYLYVIDLPKAERKEVMIELSYMGITASSLFPGLDGACEALRERFFEI